MLSGAYPCNELNQLWLEVEDLGDALREVAFSDTVVVSTAAVFVLKGGDGFLMLGDVNS